MIFVDHNYFERIKSAGALIDVEIDSNDSIGDSFAELLISLSNEVYELKKQIAAMESSSVKVIDK